MGITLKRGERSIGEKGCKYQTEMGAGSREWGAGKGTCGKILSPLPISDYFPPDICESMEALPPP